MDRANPAPSKLLPAYPLAEAARVLDTTPATLRAWFHGRNYAAADGKRHSAAVIKPSQPAGAPLSFIDLVEAHMLLAIRRGYGIPLNRFRAAMDYLREKGGDLQFLAHRDFLHDKQHLYLQIDQHLVSLSERGQHVQKDIIKDGLRQVEYGADGYVDRFYPRIGDTVIRTIALDPVVAFGRPNIARLGVSAEAVDARFQAHESVDTLMTDYGATREEIEDALRWVRHAA